MEKEVTSLSFKNEKPDEDNEAGDELPASHQPCDAQRRRSPARHLGNFCPTKIFHRAKVIFPRLDRFCSSWVTKMGH